MTVKAKAKTGKAARTKSARGTTVDYLLRVTLVGLEPPVWRLIRVSSEATLAKLRRVVMQAMGWGDEHLHQFETRDGRNFSDPGFELDADVEDERRTRLGEVLHRRGSVLTFRYDFGDDWEHEIRLEGVEAGTGGPPSCLGGARACPPEDCGGVWGYEDMLKAAADPEHEDHEDMLETLGEGFDPEAFDAAEVNRALKRIR